ncbi:hypothetical protein CKM354_000872800 [Cercospora kikuchii]|uniref:Uncharacterized protein n=1 Tax=Cercospora kikuchii TaxID=84275 RepID=A0A9P3CWD9_9PEZI|nr:uncharacterized protein CKM354_000872800 [Cercospora kikuchii]GIZ45568.1 hypothetical protein CKM354_000872800 [Cercospora kikuchii]
MATDVDLRVQTLLAKANLAPPSRLDALQRPAPLRPAIHLETIEARECLESQRPTDRTPVSPASPARLWRSIRPIKHKRQEAQSSTWITTDHEVAAVTDALLDQNPLKSVGVAQTVLQHARAASLDQLWRSLHGGELHTGVPWLSRIIQRSTVTSPRELDYIQLLCETGPSPEVLDAAFYTAFDKGCAASMGLLLSYDADASRCQEGVRKRVQLGHLDMIKLLLAAPRSIRVGTLSCTPSRCRE